MRCPKVKFSNVVDHTRTTHPVCEIYSKQHCTSCISVARFCVAHTNSCIIGTGRIRWPNGDISTGPQNT